jgi:hypothetical protein
MYVTGVLIITSMFLCTQRTNIYRYVKRNALAREAESQAQEDEIKTKIRVLPRYVQHMHAPRPRTNIRTI